MKYSLNWLTECDSTVIFNVISQLNAKNKMMIVLLAGRKLQVRAHINYFRRSGNTNRVDLPTYMKVGFTLKQLIWQRQSNSCT